MRVLAIGGSGGMGRFAVRTAERYSGVESILVADLNNLEAEKFAATLGKKVIGIGLDVLDKNSLKKTLKYVDIVLNTSGPFFKLGVPILEAVIDSGCHYLDICDDWEPTIEMLKLNDRAKEKGVSAIIGLGASPGISNLLGLMAIHELDEVKKVYTGWNMEGAKPEEESSQKGTNAAMEHAIEQMTGRVKVFLNSEFKLIKPMRKIEVDYPGSGKAFAKVFGHPEAVTFPSYFPGLEESLNLAHGNEDTDLIISLLLSLVEWKILPKKTAAKIFGWLEAKVPMPDYDNMHKPSLPAIYGLAIGTRNGKKASVGTSIGSVHSQDSVVDTSNIGMGSITGIPLACGLKMLLDGQITERGVLAPESGAINPQYFFSEVLSALQGKESSTKPSIEGFVHISRSWEV